MDRLIQQALLQVLTPRIDPTFSAHSHKPVPKAAPKESAMNAGNASKRQSGRKSYQAIINAISPSVIRKSIKLVMTEPAGTMRRGK